MFYSCARFYGPTLPREQEDTQPLSLCWAYQKRKLWPIQSGVPFFGHVSFGVGLHRAPKATFTLPMVW